MEKNCLLVTGFELLLQASLEANRTSQLHELKISPYCLNQFEFQAVIASKLSDWDLRAYGLT